jgi:hypothetical protein
MFPVKINTRNKINLLLFGDKVGQDFKVVLVGFPAIAVKNLAG